MPNLVQRREASTFAEGWTAEVNDSIVAMAVADDTVVVAVRNDTIYLLSAGDGSSAGDLGTAGNGVLNGAMVAEAGWIYAVCDNDGVVTVARHALP